MAAAVCPNLIAVFDDRLEADRAVRDLEAAGFEKNKIGFAIRGSEVAEGGMITDATGTKDARGAVAGAAAGAVVGGLLGAAASVLLPGVGPVLVGGVLASFFGGAAAGTAVGGILGAMEGLEVSAEEAKYYEQMFNSGKAIVAVKPGDLYDEAFDIIRRHNGYNFQCRPTSPVATRGIFSKP
ncbi:MAG TPA: hypothetical protein VH518_17740 [Tepidisphaeraceae bacterium]|jgi:hypothetical protein